MLMHWSGSMSVVPEATLDGGGASGVLVAFWER